LKRKRIQDTLKNVKIKNKIEKTGFFVEITNNEESKQKAVNVKKRTEVKNIKIKKFF